MEIFKESKIGNLILKNRIFRSATFEGLGYSNGTPKKELLDYYLKLAKKEVGAIITGFTYFSDEGKAIQKGQCSMNEKDINVYKKITSEINEQGCRIFAQLAHTGRQTKKSITLNEVVGVSKKKSLYFRGKVKKLKKTQIKIIIKKFIQSAENAKKSGFNGVQLHCAHGYLIHQFILPSINNRKDKYGIDKKIKIGIKFLEEIVIGIREKCGKDFPILVKISASDDYNRKFSKKQFINLINFLDRIKVDGIEISYGTMDYALNIFRGEIPYNYIFEHNAIYRTNNIINKFLLKIFLFPLLKLKLKPFLSCYNLDFSVLAKKYTTIPIISVGGFRQGQEIEKVLKDKKADYVSLSRPFIIEPDFVSKIKKDITYVSKCINCNRCAIMCDSEYKTKCWKNIDIKN